MNEWWIVGITAIILILLNIYLTKKADSIWKNKNEK